MASKDLSLKELYAAQSASRGLISRAVDNFTKLGKAQRTTTVTSSRLSNLRGYWEKFVQQHMQILALADKEATAKDEYFVKDLFVETSCIFEEACDYFNEYLAKLKPPPVAQSSFDETHVANSQNVVNSIKLPQITMPTFSGDFHEWENYRDLFLALVDQNVALTGVQRLHYLKSSLSGEAALTLKNIAVTESNYTTAWELLRKRYDNTRLIVHSHLRTLTEIPNINRPSAKELRNLRDKANDVRQALTNLGRPVASWDDLFNFLIISKLDRASLNDWELQLGSSTALPSFAELDEFITCRIRAFDAVESSKQTAQTDESKIKKRSSDKRTSIVSHQTDSSAIKCAFCKASHALATCNKFKQKHVNERRAFLFENHLCFRCLKPGHGTAKCLSKSACVACHGKHHTLVHFKNVDSNVSSGRAAETQQKAAETDLPSTSQQDEKELSSTCHVAYSRINKALLPSACVKITADNGRTILVRALLDQGSQVTCVTERIADHLKSKKLPVAVNLSGIGGVRAGRVKHAVELEMSSCNLKDREEAKIRFSALVLKSLTSYTPSSFEFDSKWKHLVDLPLADPKPSDFQGFDLLIGANEYGKIMLDGVVKGPPGTPIAQRTVFGWVLSGSCGPTRGGLRSGLQVHHVEILDDLHKNLKKFWELEETPKGLGLTRDQLDCENHFKETHRRRIDGRYEVRLPFAKNPKLTVGDTANIARKIFQSNEVRVRKNPEVYREYQTFLQEYLDLGHMSRIRETESLNDKVFISHLPVLRQESQTTKLRVVFNASMSLLCPTLRMVISLLLCSGFCRSKR
uniref:uncharacterized protein LOC117606363 n=1 Tax=Osmia lignaria TaxID=473952 RepID=UPI0014797F48|nr:uncharacterized protein LOC117606363 [Osmia lignaria]